MTSPAVPVLLAAAMLGAVSVMPRPALAQAPIVATPLPEIDPQAPAEPAEPAAPPQSPQRAPSFPNVWVPRQGATIQALDKINARSATLTVPTGQTATYQGLTIAVRSCLVRPSDQPADAAAYVTVTDKQNPTRPIGLWLIRSAPAVSMLEHPIFDLRVIGCG